jgi:release factor glutamine methyltransferase
VWADLFDQALAALGHRQAARWLVEDASGRPWPSVLDELVPVLAGQTFLSMLDRRLAGEPLQYVLGHWAFRGLDLMVNHNVLIPRPETEVVVEVALAQLDRAARGAPAGWRPRVLDLGTGSGAIALSIAMERPASQVWATDLSQAALDVASANLAGLGSAAGARAHLAQGTWWEALPPGLEFDLVVTNPPYISNEEMTGLSAEVSGWEPRQALVAGPTGLEALEVILAGCPPWMAPGSSLVAEIAPHQAPVACALARAVGFTEVAVRPDLAGRPRVLEGRRPR